MKSKKLILVIVIIIGIVVIGLCVGAYILNNKDKEKIAYIQEMLKQELRLSDRTIEYGTEINFIEEDENKGTNHKFYIDNHEISNYKFDKLGNIEIYEINYTYYTNFLNQTKKIEVNKVSTYMVEDTKKPIIEGVSDKEIIVGDSIDLKAGIVARDEIDGILDIVIEGEVDTNTSGEYYIKVIAKDRNDNTTEVTYVVRVNNKQEVRKETKNINTNKSSKDSVNKDTSNKSQSTNGKSQEEQSTYQYKTYGDKIYFEEDRGEKGNYSEKFTW